MKNGRATFGSRLSAILVAAGSAVGLGNIWRFPYVAGENGGGAFLLIYIGCILLLGLPVLLAEFAIGRNSRRNSVGAYKSIAEKSKGWSIIGYNSVAASFLILGFYFVVSGWTLEYFITSVTGDIAEYTSSTINAERFDAFMLHPVRPIIYTLIFVLLTHTVIVMGVQKGIERSAKMLMPLLFIILIVLSIRSITLPDGIEGLKFFFRPDFSKVTAGTFLDALGQAFFSLSISLGCMITYASYFKDDTDLRTTALNVTLLDSVVAVLAGTVIFPAVFSAGIAPAAGPSLVFITLPSIFNTMSLGAIWSAIFFLLLVLAALTSTISLHEVLTAYVHEEWHLSRKNAARAATLATALLACVASLSLGIWREYTICGSTLFDALDLLTANIMLPLGGLFTSLFVGWKMNGTVLHDEITNRGKLKFGMYRAFVILLRYVCPLLLLMIFLYNSGLFSL